jgi:hypothetical protein
MSQGLPVREAGATGELQLALTGNVVHRRPDNKPFAAIFLR